jgi:hypothetical protein
MLTFLIENQMKKIEETIFRLKRRKKPLIPFSVRVEAFSALFKTLQFLAAAERLEKKERMKNSENGLEASKTLKQAHALYKAYLSLALGLFP